MSNPDLKKIEAIIGQCQSLYEDLALNYVTDWKKKNNSLAIGFLPVYFPRELAHASGLLPVGIMGGGDQIEIIKGDAYFQSYICHIPRSVIEMGLSGLLNPLDGMVFPAICDVIRNLSGMWQVMFEEKESLFFDVPQNFNSEIGGEFYQRELKRILRVFEKMSGNKVSDDSLKKSILLYNKNRELIEKLYKCRSGKPWEVPTTELYLLIRAGMIMDVCEHNSLLEEYLDLLSSVDRKPLDNSRVILTGSFCEQPSIGLIRALERSGCYIVDDDFVMVSRWITGDILKDGDLIKNIAHAYLTQSMEAPSKYQPEKKGEQLLKSFRDNKAEGVIFSAPSFCDPALLDRPMIQRFLDSHKIPYTSFRYAENMGQYQVIKEQAGTFSDSLKLWGEGA